MKLRVLHRRVALIFSPFLILSSLTGIALFFRKDDLYSKDTKNLLLGLHNWEIVTKYVGIILALALLFISVTGIMIFLKNKKF